MYIKETRNTSIFLDNFHFTYAKKIRKSIVWVKDFWTFSYIWRVFFVDDATPFFGFWTIISFILSTMVINSKNSITVSQSYKMRGKTRTFKFITFIKNVYLFMWGNKAKQFPVDIRIQESGRQIPVSREVDGNFSSNRITTNHICAVLEEQFTGFSKLLYSYLRDSYGLV